MIERRKQIIQWLEEDKYRYQALLIAESLNLPQWMLAAGFVRNLVWDKLHALNSRQLNDIDLIYFDADNLDPEIDKHYQSQLNAKAPEYPWSVKNQARMHLKNQDRAYHSCIDAMSYWPEKETAVAASISRAAQPQIELYSPFGCERLFELTVSHNPIKSKLLFEQRLKSKKWLTHYSQLIVI
ncbi:nucleotidyltransferase family protein [Shewanella kaireitica]|uniref:nucleotidyltransferase family protein n=1 Tax=Shewanella kaireitica TaxID=212021 RepID=UPI00200F003F|nr:nucleotidyltransferase family protein [Shewanella kaireitica]MCL1093319.1 nucleotidyltransferase family protein [Shewanella kaireitica]